MCPGCRRVWTGLHVLWGAIYVTCGAAQLIAGIFFIISLPPVHLTCNLWTGSWNVIVGIGGGMLACFVQLSPRRQEYLLYIAGSILTVNVVNAVLSEFAFYWANMPSLILNHPYHTLIIYACFATRLATAVAIILSFVDSQLSFCSMHAAPKKNKKKLRGSHEQVSDIEYIIPRQKPSKPHTVYNAYSQSWVFDADNASSSNHTDSPYLKLKNGTPKKIKTDLQNGIVNDTAHLIDNPVVHVEEASDDSNSNSDRKLGYMKSFSRSASPAPLSASSSQLSLNNPPIYECLEKLTEPTIYRSRLNSALSNKDSEEQHYQAPQSVMKRVEASTPQVEKVQYASLMKELQKAIVSKKEAPSASNSTASDKSSGQESSKSEGKNSDAEFSKELEAALQLIQDLESPNTVETPSDAKDPRPLTVWRNSDASESEKTLSAVGSIAEITSPLAECQPELYTFRPQGNGKSAHVVYSDSQSTSGYSSPTHAHTPNNWSAASSVNGSNNDIVRPMSYYIHNTKSAAVISLFSQENASSSNGKSVTLVRISGDNRRVRKSNETALKSPAISDLVNNNYPEKKNVKVTPCRRPSFGSTAVWNVKSLLRKKKSNLPRLCPELEEAIVKSESLAYLSERELLARHQRNSEIQRQIEERVLQQLGTPKIDASY